jgi:hypothetical protein
MNGKTFQGLSEYEAMPLQKWLALAQIHTQAVEREKAEWEKANKR